MAGSAGEIGKVAREHQDALLTALSREERNELTSLLLRIADQQGLVRGVHPGYQRLGSPGVQKPMGAGLESSKAAKPPNRPQFIVTSNEYRGLTWMAHLHIN